MIHSNVLPPIYATHLIRDTKCRTRLSESLCEFFYYCRLGRSDFLPVAVIIVFILLIEIIILKILARLVRLLLIGIILVGLKSV